MSADIVRRLMDSAEDANDDLRSKSFHGTLASDSSAQDVASRIDAATGTSTPVVTSGKVLFERLTARAQHKEHITDTLSANPALQDYASSMVGSASQDSDLRRQLTHRHRAERRAREKRFGSNADNSSRSDSLPLQRQYINKRQRYNANGSLDKSAEVDHGNQPSRQDVNAKPSSPRTTFREPPSRSYDPYNH